MIIFGLGNPGEEYQYTRHNLGFLVIDLLAKKWNLHFTHKYDALFSEKDGIFLVKPLLYMNNSGLAMKKWLDNVKDDFFVILDDVNIPFGVIRIRKTGSHGGHNGLKSIIDSLQTEDFPRLRIGIGPKPEDIPLDIFVLSPFSKDEIKQLKDTMELTMAAIDVVLKEGIEQAMNRFNGWRLP